MTPERIARLRQVLDRRQPDLTVVTDFVHKQRNLSAIVRDYREHGEALWDRFNADRDEICWYYSEMTQQLSALGVAPAEELGVKYAELRGLVENVTADL